MGFFDVTYRDGTSDENVLADSFDKDPFFSQCPEYESSMEDVIMDVGAHIGTFSILAARKVPKGRVYAIEASEDSFRLLCTNMVLNNLFNVFPYRLALSDSDGTISLFYDNENWGHSIVSPLTGKYEIVRSMSLESFMNKNGIVRCNFVKFNCEGAEFPIILGSSSHVLRRFEHILVLYHCDLWTKNSWKDIFNHLTGSGFNVRVFNQTEARGWMFAKRE